MSKDIRSYFTKLPASKANNEIGGSRPKKKKPVISSDEEEQVEIIKETPKKEKKPTQKTAKKHVLSDSDDESPVKKKPSTPKNVTKKKEPEVKPVSVAEMLGKTPVKRINAPKVPSKEKEKKVKEADFHDDDEFEATLSQLDTSEIEAEYFKDRPEGQNSGKRKKHNSSVEEVSAKKQKLDEEKPKKEKIKDKKEEKSSTSKSPDVVTNASPAKQTKVNGVHENTSKKLNFDSIKKTSKTKSNVEVIVEKTTKPEKKVSDDEVDLLEERIAKKKQATASYQQYLSRGGARNPGSKPIPEGAENCLAGLSFVLTGVYESLQRDEAAELIQKYGGRVTAAVSKKTDYVVVGDEAGQSKLAKASALMLKQISEDELLDLIRSRPAGNPRDIVHSKSRKKAKSLEKSPESKPEKSTETKDKSLTKSPIKASPTEDSPKKKATKSSTSPRESKTFSAKKDSPKAEELTRAETSTSFAVDTSQLAESQALVEKYRPKAMKHIIGQHGDKSNAKKFHTWLSNWHKNRKVKHTKPSLYAKNDDGGFFKACLFSGPPGVGKTTTAQVVCNELGFDLLEFNASDTRSKKLLKEEVSSLLSNTTMKGFFGDAKEKPTSKHVLLMDEVDGMAGNEDRGGLQELIALIKSTDIPIICICNDRNNPKMRTLANYVYDLRFQKPQIAQIRGAMKSLCCKENIKISNEDLDRLIEAANQDIRQVINHLAMLVNDPTKNTEQSAKLNKDLKLGPWDVVRKVFSAEEHKKMSIHDKSDLFFHDYNIAGLFVQENYLSVAPRCPKDEILKRVADSADSLSLGDQVEKAIRSNGAWALLPTQACYASVIPGSRMSGSIVGQIQFPAWLGRNSKRAKFDRILQEITVHTRLATGASKEAINLDYLAPLRNAIMRPLVTEGSEGVDAAIKVMNDYQILREDLEGLTEVSLWPGQRDPMQMVESKVKSAFTRTYNKNSAPARFVVNTTVSKKKGQISQDEGFIDDDDDTEIVDDESGEEDSLDADKMIKAKKPGATKATASTSKNTAKPAAANKRGRGRGK